MKKRICLIFEGTYPYVKGGVAEWAHELISSSPEYEFAVVAITDRPRSARDARYVLPPQVKVLRVLNLHEPLNPLITWTQSLRLRRKGKAMANFMAKALSDASNGNYRSLGTIIHYIDEHRLNRLDIRRNPNLWPILTEVYYQTGAQHAFSPFFWAWDNLVSTTLRLMRDPLPTADIYHSASTGLSGFLGTVSKIRTGKPFVVSEHGLYLQERQMELAFNDGLTFHQRRTVEGFFEGLSRWIYSEADKVTSLSGFIRDHQIAMGAKERKTEIIPNGVALDRFSAVQRKEHRGFHVGLVGRIAPVKDIELLLVAAKELVPVIPELKVSIIGPVEDHLYFEECKRKVEQLNLQDTVQFTGPKKQEDCYSDLDALVMCSVKEVQPLTLLEGMAVGIPIIATRTGAIPEMMANASIIIPPRDPRALIRAIRKIHDDKEFAQKMVETGRERVKSYDLTKMISRFHNIYDTVGKEEKKPWPALV